MRISILAKIIDLLFPRFCAMCGNRLVGEEEMVCMSCLLHLPRTDTWGNPYENEMAKIFWHRMPIEKSAALFYYQGHSLASNLIYQLKYQNHPEMGEFLGRMIAQEARCVNYFDDIDAIVPIPLAKNRRKQRGYNQSEEIAKGIAAMTGLPIWTDVVERTQFSESQTHKDRWERAENVENVFVLSSNDTMKTCRSLEGKHLLLIDDVCTTGATIVACAHALMKIPKVKFSVITIGYAKG